MKAVGIICEYNPFHYGHEYHILEVKKKFPEHLIILVLNGYFLERGEVSILSKEDKTKIALEYGVDLVVLLPVVFGTQSSDIFASKAMEILNHFQVSDVLFGSECNNSVFLKQMALEQMKEDFSISVNQFLKTGVNYPTALSKSLSTNVVTPNDLLGISYWKAVLKNHYPITLHTMKRTNSYHDLSSHEKIISASNIRNKLKQGEDISLYVPDLVISHLQICDENKVWQMLKFRILTDPFLDKYMTVDEGVAPRLKKMAFISKNLEDFIQNVKTKRYTYNKIRRMTCHILLGFTKEDNDNLVLDYLQILGFNQKGQQYLKDHRKEITLPFQNKKSKIWEYEKKAAYLYEEFTHLSVQNYEFLHKPIVKL